MGRKKPRSPKKPGPAPEATETTTTTPAATIRPEGQQRTEWPSLGPTRAQPPQVASVAPQPMAASDKPSTSQRPDSSGVPQGADSTAAPQQPSTSKSEKSDETLASEVTKKLFIPKLRESRPFPRRPKSLTIGTPLALLANHFLLTVGKKKAYHYDIEIERAVKPVKKDSNVVDKDVEESNIAEKKKNQFAKKMATRLNRKIFAKMVDFYSNNDNRVFQGMNPVYDGQKNMFTSRKLRGTENKGILRLRVDLNDEGRDSSFHVNIKLAETNEEIDLNILNLYHGGKTCDDEVLKKSVLFINTLLRHNSTMNWVPIGQSIFDPEKLGQRLGQYLLLSYGFYSSVRNLMVGPTLNIDRSAAAFYDSSVTLQKLIGFLMRGDLMRIPANGLSDSDRRKIKRELSGLQVEAIHIQYGGSYRKYRILGLTRESAKDIKFDWIERNKDGVEEVKQKQVSVRDYFLKKYNITLKSPQFPCLEVGNPNNVVKLPLEVCRLVSHQRLRRTMYNTERSEMTRVSGQQTPLQRLDMCKDFVEKQFHSGEMGLKNRPFLSEFEINVDKNLLRVDSKVIEPPKLRYGGQNSRPVIPNNGEWEMFKTGACFLKAMPLDNWIVINMSFTDSLKERDIDDFCRELCAQAKEMGMPTRPPNVTANINTFTPRTTFTGIKRKIKTMTNLKMILFVTPDKADPYSDEIYSEIKLLGDVETTGGLTTQCVNINSIWNKRDRRRKWNRSYFRQLMLKVNPKLGGTNVALLDSTSMPPIFKKKSLMIIGADVNHPAPADKISPSIAALVGSYDNEYSNYYTTVSMQPKSREEMIKYLDEMVVELLANYKVKQKGILPDQIIFYRDGVSEGQFQHVIDNEYPLLTKAFAKVKAGYKPKLTFIVVQKRHHTRFMRADNKQNVPPGTVVETSITHKRDFDFYLCSHAGRIGTSRSAHYYVLADENGFSSDDMCKMTYYLCHIYQRCTKSVSIPAPVYYADLAAYRAKVHASPHLTASDVSSVVSDEGGDEIQIKSFKDMIKVSAAQKEKLYFC